MDLVTHQGLKKELMYQLDLSSVTILGPHGYYPETNNTLKSNALNPMQMQADHLFRSSPCSGTLGAM